MPTVYSIVYKSRLAEREPYATFAIDWKDGRWTRSVHHGLSWEPAGGLDEESYEALLMHFGLKDWRESFPVDLIAAMNPKDLALFRRRKEAELWLSLIVIKSDTLGAHIPAEEYIG